MWVQTPGRASLSLGAQQCPTAAQIKRDRHTKHAQSESQSSETSCQHNFDNKDQGIFQMTVPDFLNIPQCLWNETQLCAASHQGHCTMLKFVSLSSFLPISLPHSQTHMRTHTHACIHARTRPHTRTGTSKDMKDEPTLHQKKTRMHTHTHTHTHWCQITDRQQTLH